MTIYMIFILSLADACFRLNKWSECEKYLNPAIEIIEKKELCLTYIANLQTLARVFQAQGKVAEAEAAFMKSIDVLKTLEETH